MNINCAKLSNCATTINFSLSEGTWIGRRRGLWQRRKPPRPDDTRLGAVERLNPDLRRGPAARIEEEDRRRGAKKRTVREIDSDGISPCGKGRGKWRDSSLHQLLNPSAAYTSRRRRPWPNMDRSGAYEKGRGKWRDSSLSHLLNPSAACTSCIERPWLLAPVARHLSWAEGTSDINIGSSVFWWLATSRKHAPAAACWSAE